MKVFDILHETIDLTKTVPVELNGKTFLPITGDIVGKGLQSMVHKGGTGTVVKQAFIDKNQGLNDASVQALKMITEHQDNPFFPKIYHAKIYEDKTSGNMVMLVQMEKLIPITDKKIQDVILSQIKQLNIDIVDPKKFDPSRTGIKDKITFTMNQIPDIIDDIITGNMSFSSTFGRATNPKFIEAMALVIRGSHKYGADLHASNWMARLTPAGPQLVIIDPFQPSSFRPGKEYYDPDMETDYETDKGVYF